MAGVDGKAVVTYKKPNVGNEYPVKVLPTSDEFDSNQLGMQWGWNHNPEQSKWSLTANPGHLRLSTVSVVDSLPKARNTLTQRMFAYYSDSTITQSTVKINIENMNDGDIAGLVIFQDPYAYIGVKKSGEKQYVVMVNNGKSIDSSEVKTSTIYLKASAFFGSGAAMYYGGDTVPGTGTARFSYSTDQKLFSTLENVLQMQFNLSVFTGNKICIFNYATSDTGGYVDIDWLRVEPQNASNL